jgi:hypothetical protein
LAIAGVAGNIWPGSPWKPVLAASLLVASPQFLVMSMTGYSMPAHLAFNLLWLWLFTDEKKRRYWLAPLVGVIAIGLHQPIVHALFVTPFLFRLVRQRKWPAVLIFGLIYLAGCAGWYWWRAHFQPPTTAGTASIFRLLNPLMFVVQPMDLLLIIGWGCLALPLLAFLGFRRFFTLPPILQDAAVSCLITFAFYFFFYLDQGHGWGYRYFHGTFGCLILLAVAGWDSLKKVIGTHAAATFVVCAIMASVMIQLPLRCQEAETFVRPYARANELFHQINADLVVFDPRLAWYSADLLRNDPFLKERPIIVSFFRMKEAESTLLQKRFPRNRIISKEDMKRLGLATEPES